MELGDRLIEAVLEQERAGDELDDLAYALLDELWGGYPLDHLHRLLESDNDIAVNTAAWILSELGEESAQFMTEVDALLESPHWYARYFALDVVVNYATADADGATIAKAVRLICDEVQAVRKKSLRFLAHLKTEKLHASLPYLVGTPVGAFTMWLLELRDDATLFERLSDRLDHADWLTRAFAAVAAARLWGENASVLEQAARSTDDVINSFAKLELDLNRIRRR